MSAWVVWGPRLALRFLETEEREVWLRFEGSEADDV